MLLKFWSSRGSLRPAAITPEQQHSYTPSPPSPASCTQIYSRATMAASSPMVALPRDLLAQFSSAYIRNRPAIQRVLTPLLALYLIAGTLSGFRKVSKGGGGSGGKSRRRGKGEDAGSSSRPQRVKVRFSSNG